MRWGVVPTEKGVRFVVVRIFGMSVIVAVAALVAAFLYGGPRALFLAAVLEVHCHSTTPSSTPPCCNG